MLELRKDKQFLHFDFNYRNTIKHYAIDMNTNDLYQDTMLIGKCYDREIPGLPTRIKEYYKAIPTPDQDTNLYVYLLKIISEKNNLFNPNMFKLIDRIMSAQYQIPIADLGLCNIPTVYYDFINKYFNKIPDFMQTQPVFNIYKFQSYIKSHERKKTFRGQWATRLTEEHIQKIYAWENEAGGIDILNKYIDTIAYYLINCKFDKYNLYYHIICYINNCKYLDKEPIKTANGLREFAETDEAATLLKDKHKTEGIKKAYEPHPERWKFSYNGFTIVIPQSNQDLIEEGQKMHHCVGRYASHIINKWGFVFFVRRENTIDTPYITGFARYKDGHISDYFYAYDKNVYKEQDIEFKKALQEHFIKTW